jgi:phosphoesterase RecJ-like protein
VNGSCDAVAASLRERQSFLITSHARPDGDAIGSSLALGLALECLGKHVTVMLRDPVPGPYRSFPAIDRIVQASEATIAADAAVLLECSEIGRPEIAGLDRYFVINVDHHLGNAMYGAVNWFDDTAAACGELVADLIDALQVPWTQDIAAHLYLALSTDTGGFRYGPISAHTFEICRRIAETGIQTAQLSRQIFDSFTIGRVKVTGALLNTMELYHDEQLAVLCVDDELLKQSGATIDDTEGLVNLPLGAREVAAVALFKRQSGNTFRLSLRSKGAVDVRAIAARWNGGGHHNAAGCTITGEYGDIRDAVVQAMAQALDGRGTA